MILRFRLKDPGRPRRPIIKWVLDQAIDRRQLLGVTKERLELEDTKKFENMLHDKIQVLDIELEGSITARDEEVLISWINILKCVLGDLFKLKPYAGETRAIEIAEADHDFRRATRLRK